ncbi:energy transducer TonB [Pontixanthobacter gangjinensis]|uniref:Energy transducer TonB n=1 Tax=Christiangramia aestuarii TaxID=1028746 RepID=A0A7K1LN40_9FLAO|nr:energy transducer TonB [Christiangramia aestuarii]MUP42148.1 energy transducer TonB [Christiangramia aestuarii]
MKPKKNPKADLRRKWVLFLQIGLVLVLFLTLQAFNWKSYEVIPKEKTKVEIDDPVEETPPVTIVPEITPPPPPKTIIDKVETVPDDKDVTEDAVVDPNLDLEDLPEPADIVEPDDDEEPVKVPFDFIEEVPVFPGCEELTANPERKECMSSKISNFVNKEFDTRLGAELGLSGTKLVVVMFVVNKDGLVEQIQVRAPHPELEKEGRRVIAKLPQMRPGRQAGKPVPVSYTIPIRFRVQE